MEKAVFDLYLDESGAFEKPGERTLIGGFMIPREKNPSFKTMQSWETQIRRDIVKAGLLTEAELEAGDEWHKLYHQTDSPRRRELAGMPRYTFGHCRDNTYDDRRSIPRRWETQGWILDNYMKTLKACGGFPVVFDNPGGVYHIDSNTTYMTIFASGVVQLYNKLMTCFQGREIVLCVHTASRLNTTRKFDPAGHAVSPMAGHENILEKALYINQIKNYVFLHGGSDLLDLTCFQESIGSLDILYDITKDGVQFPHPATIICDYICNSMLTDSPRRGFRRIMDAAGLLLFMAFGEKPDLSDASILLMAQRHDWLSFLKLIISREFPREETDQFFELMKQDTGYSQMTCVNGLISYLYPFVENREDMEEWAGRLNLIIRQGARFDPDAYLFLKANVLIFLHALETHMGKDTASTRREFELCIREISAMEQRDELLILFCNRQIVTATDCFNFNEGEEWFEAIRSYSEAALRNSDDLLTWFCMLSGKDPAITRSEQYGKALGSYVQLLTKELRAMTGSAREEKAAIGISAAEDAFRHLSGAGNQSRAHQNMCDLLSETGRYEVALNHLCLAISGTDTGDFRSKAETVLQICGRYGEQKRGLFPYLHYVSLMHRCFRTHDPRGEIMLQRILKESPRLDRLEHLMGDPHPQAVILWHLAASMAASGNYGKMASELFEASISALNSGSKLFRTIGMAVQAEMIALGLEGNLPGAEKLWKKKAEDFFRKAYRAYAAEAVHNPFADIVPNEETPVTPDSFYRFADCVVY